MTDRERLIEWMDKRNLGNVELANMMGIHRTYAYMIVTGARPVSDSFKWRFGEAFGILQAKSVFSEYTERPELIED